MLRKEKGITLVALVVTIVVLLILAGISLSLVIGQNGITTKAQEGAKNYTNAAAEEKENLEALDQETNDILSNALD